MTCVLLGRYSRDDNHLGDDSNDVGENSNCAVRIDTVLNNAQRITHNAITDNQRIIIHNSFLFTSRLTTGRIG